jgi:hypothetical protein
MDIQYNNFINWNNNIINDINLHNFINNQRNRRTDMLNTYYQFHRNTEWIFNNDDTGMNVPKKFKIFYKKYIQNNPFFSNINLDIDIKQPIINIIKIILGYVKYIPRNPHNYYIFPNNILSDLFSRRFNQIIPISINDIKLYIYTDLYRYFHRRHFLYFLVGCGFLPFKTIQKDISNELIYISSVFTDVNLLIYISAYI